jgi:hypothetical protein
LERNVGPGLAAQAAMDEARGEYLIRVDADDVQDPGRFTAQVAFLNEHPGVIACGSAIQLIGDGDAVRAKPVDRETCRMELLFGVAIFQPTMAVRRSSLMEHGIRYRAEWPRVGEDRLFQVELAQVGALSNVPDALVRYRLQGQGISQKGVDLAVRSAQDRAAFEAFGFPVLQEEELQLFAWSRKRFDRIPDREGLERYNVLLDRLGQWNAEHGPFDVDVFEQRLRLSWDELLHHLPQFGRKVTWQYIRRGAHLDAARLYYLLRAFMAPGGPRRWQADRSERRSFL